MRNYTTPVTRSIAVVLGGDASVATNGFWSALTVATTLQLPMLFYIEDNGFGISVSSKLQTPGGNIAANLRSFAGLTIIEGDGTDPAEAAERTARAVSLVRDSRAPVLLRLTVPRLSGHSGQDTQAYKSPEVVASSERAILSESCRVSRAECHVGGRLESGCGPGARRRGGCDCGCAGSSVAGPGQVTRYVFAKGGADGVVRCRSRADLRRKGMFSRRSEVPHPEGTRINMMTAIRRTLDVELASNSEWLCLARTSDRKAAFTGRRWGCRKSTARSGCSIPVSPRRALSGAPLGCRSPDCCPWPKFSFASMPTRRPSSSTIAARCVGAHGITVRGADGGADAGRVLQVRRSVA